MSTGSIYAERRIVVSPTDPRQLKGAQLAAANAVSYDLEGYRVASQSGKGSYLVKLTERDWTCTCPDARKGNRCKHQYAMTVFRAAEKRAARAVLEGTLPSLKSYTLSHLCQPVPSFVSDCFQALWHAIQRTELCILDAASAPSVVFGRAA